jgi:hypothetical protein
VLEAANDRLRRSVAGVGAVEVGQDVGGPVLQRPPERDVTSLKAAGTSWLMEAISLVMS